jgi:hypothetical protein
VQTNGSVSAAAGAPERERPAERRRDAHVIARQGFVHDARGRSVPRIALVERPPGRERDAERAEVRAADGPDLGCRPRRRCGCRLAIRLEETCTRDRQRPCGRQQSVRDDERRDAQQRGRDKQPGETAQRGQHEVLGAELQEQTFAIRAEHGADRKLVAACRRARQQQIRNVRETDQQDEADDAEEQQRSPAQVGAEDGVAQRLDHDAAALIRCRILARQVGRDARHLGPRGLPRYARLQSRHGLEKVRAAHGFRQLLNRHQRPDVRGAQQLGLVRHDADDRVGLAVEPKALADDIRVGVEAAAPVGLGEHGDPGLGAVVGRDEGPPDDRCDAERAEDAGRDPLPRHILGAVRPAQDHRADVRHEPGHRVERRRTLSPIFQVRRRDEARRRRPGQLRDRHEAPRARERQLAQQHRVDERKDRAVRADAERERRDDGRREPGLLAEHAHGKSQVLPQVRE